MTDAYSRYVQERLSAVNLSKPIYDRVRAEKAIAGHLSELGVEPLPVRWEPDAVRAYLQVYALAFRAAKNKVDYYCRRGNAEMERLECGYNACPSAYEAALSAVMSRAMHRRYSRLGSGTSRMDHEIFQGLFGQVNSLIMGTAFTKAFGYALREAKAAPAGSRWTRRLDIVKRATTTQLKYARLSAIDLANEAGFRILDRDAGARRRGATLRRALLPMLDAFDAGLWLWWICPRAKMIVACTRPALLHSNRNGGLHSDSGAAVFWPNHDDTPKYHFLGGLRVSSKIGEPPGEGLDPAVILHTPNLTVRRELVQKIGIERILQKLDAKVIDRWRGYELVVLNLQDGRTRPYLRMKNPSLPGVWHVEGVHPACSTVKDALNFRNGTSELPDVLT